MLGTNLSRRKIQELLSKAGIVINGTRPWDITVHDERFYRRVLTRGSLGIGESYMDAWWESGALDQTFDLILRSQLERTVTGNAKTRLMRTLAMLGNPQRPSKAFEVGEKHYDIGNDLYEAMLDSRMTYTCGYWKDAHNLEEAQEAKLDLVCKKLGLKPGHRILDVGCGWGSFLKYASERYGVRGVGITVSKEQAALARERCKGLPIEIRLQDYRDTEGTYDHIASLGMFEHVGPKNYRAYFSKIKTLLKDGGLFLLHTIGSDITAPVDPWIEKYIFPNSQIPSLRQVADALEGLFIMEDWHNFGADYDTTLMAWFSRFDAHWEEFKHRYDERFYRMWKYYLLVSAASFRARKNQLWQIVLSPQGVPGGYTSIR